jgi:hypothetical protein
MALMPSHGPVGPSFAVRAERLQPGVPLDVVWTDVDGAWVLGSDGTAFLGRRFTATTTVLATAPPPTQPAPSRLL